MNTTTIRNGDGGGLIGFFLRIWYCLKLYYIGVKWGLIEIFTKHRKFNLDQIPCRKGDVVVITGGARGIGASAVKMFLQAEMNVIIGCRNISVGTELIAKLEAEIKGKIGKAEVIHLDLASLDSAQEFANTILSRSIPIHLLINNAGIMFCPYSKTIDDLESQFQVNYLSHFLITALLLPRLISSGTNERLARIVNVSSIAHYGGIIDFNDLQMEKIYSRYNSYMRSKLCQILSSNYLNDWLISKNFNVRALSCHPGMVHTELYQYVTWFKVFHILVRLVFKTPEQGADVLLYSALSQNIEGQGGIFIANSSKWSPNPICFDINYQSKLWEISVELIGNQRLNLIVEFDSLFTKLERNDSIQLNF